MVSLKNIISDARNRAVNEMDAGKAISGFLKKCDRLHLSNQEKVEMLQKIVDEVNKQIDLLKTE